MIFGVKKWNFRRECEYLICNGVDVKRWRCEIHNCLKRKLTALSCTLYYGRRLDESERADVRQKITPPKPSTNDIRHRINQSFLNLELGIWWIRITRSSKKRQQPRFLGSNYPPETFCVADPCLRLKRKVSRDGTEESQKLCYFRFRRFSTTIDDDKSPSSNAYFKLHPAWTGGVNCCQVQASRRRWFVCNNFKLSC